jgi:hypothetical protein
MDGPDHNPTVPLVVATPFDKAVEAQRMAEEVRDERNHSRKVELALRLVDFILCT